MDKVTKAEEIKVLDKGKNIDINIIPMMAICCGALFIPFRW